MIHVLHMYHVQNLQALTRHVQQMQHPPITHTDHIHIKISLESPAVTDSYYANTTHDIYPIYVIYMPQTTHLLHTLLTYHKCARTHVHVCPTGRLWGSCIVKIPLREKCLILATEAVSPPPKLHKDFSKERSLLLTSITCLINSQAWLEDLTQSLISIQGKIKGELKGLMSWVRTTSGQLAFAHPVPIPKPKPKPKPPR